MTTLLSSGSDTSVPAACGSAALQSRVDASDPRSRYPDSAVRGQSGSASGAVRAANLSVQVSMRAWDEAESSPMLQRSVVPLSVPYDMGVLQNRGQGSPEEGVGRHGCQGY